MERVKPSRQSLFTAQDLKYLPVSLLNWTGGEERDMLNKASENGMTLEDFRTSKAKHPIHALKIKGNTMTFSDDGCDYVVDELAKGDFDGDGYEDALVLMATYYQGGSGRFYEAYVVSKTDPKQHSLKLSKLNAVLQSTTDSPVKTKALLKCSPNIVKLVGVIKNQTFPGPPNYKSVANGDEPENYWILKLAEPIDVDKDPDYPVPDENSPQLNQRNLQVLLYGDDYNKYEKFLGKKVEVTGELGQGFTVHHKTPVMIGVRDIKAVE